eukprot:g11464.t1
MSLTERRRKAKALEEAGAALSVKLVARSTRGQRISELQGEDAEADETFWGQGAWQEAEDGDSEFSSEEEEPDKFDKDFNDSESEEEDDNGQEENALRKNERTAKRKQPGGVYKEPKTFVAKKRKVTTPSTGTGGGGSSSAKGGKSSDGGPPGVLSKRTVRASTKNKTEKSLEVREGEAKAREAQLKRSAPQPKKTLKGQFTQKQLLLEAIQTEQENMRWILKQQRLEDEAKEDEGRPKQNKIIASRYVSRRGCVDTIFFPDAYYLPPVLRQAPYSADKTQDGSGAAGAGGAGQSGSKYDRRCKVTGAPAPYKDPLTGYYYANAAAFRQVRKRYGASARQRLKAQRQEREASEKASGGAAAGAGGGGALGGRAEGDAAGMAGSATATAVPGAVGNGSLRGGGGGGAAGGNGQGVGGTSKKHGSSSSKEGEKKAKEGEKKAKSSAGKGKGKAKSSGGSTSGKSGAGAAAGAVARAGESGTTATATAPAPASASASASAAAPEKNKTGTKRKQVTGGKGAKPVKRPFFAPSPSPGEGGAPSVLAPPVAVGGRDQPQLVPLQGRNTATIHYGGSPPASTPEGSAVVKAAAYAAVAAQQAAATGNGGGHDTASEGSAVVKAAAYAAVAAQQAAAVTAPGGFGAVAAPAATHTTVTPRSASAGRVAPVEPAAGGGVPGAMAQPMLSQHQYQEQGTTVPGVVGGGNHRWDTGSSSNSNSAVVTPTQGGWPHPHAVPTAAPLRPPQG